MKPTTDVIKLKEASVFENKGDRESAHTIYRTLAEKGNAEARWRLGLASMASKNKANSTNKTALEKYADKGDRTIETVKVKKESGMSENKKKNEPKTTEQDKRIELSGNVVVVTVGCKQCPANDEYRMFSRKESDEAAKSVGQVIECANCHGKWMLKRVQMRGVIVDAEKDAEEWRVAPLFVPILSSFDINTFKILDVPISMIEAKED